MPDKEKAKGKLKNYKLGHSRLLTCYSGLLYLLAVYGRQRAVGPSDAKFMISLTPTERLEWLAEQPDLARARGLIERLLAQYEVFLETTNAEESELIGRFGSKEMSQAYVRAAHEFGDLVFDAVTQIGAGNELHRILVV